MKKITDSRREILQGIIELGILFGNRARQWFSAVRNLLKGNKEWLHLGLFHPEAHPCCT